MIATKWFKTNFSLIDFIKANYTSFNKMIENIGKTIIFTQRQKLSIIEKYRTFSLFERFLIEKQYPRYIPFNIPKAFELVMEGKTKIAILEQYEIHIKERLDMNLSRSLHSFISEIYIHLNEEILLK